MATEEVELGPFLEQHGIESVETDLGEFIVQIDADRPSHIVKPIVHKDRREIAQSFEEHGLGAYDDTPEVITQRARVHLRRKYLEADAAITGANFISAESGRLVLVTNEGNSRFCLAATRCHIALVGIEKLVPRDRDLGLFSEPPGPLGDRADAVGLHRAHHRPARRRAARRSRGDARHLPRQRSQRNPGRRRTARSCAAFAAAPASTSAPSTGSRAATPTAASTRVRSARC